MRRRRHETGQPSDNILSSQVSKHHEDEPCEDQVLDFGGRWQIWIDTHSFQGLCCTVGFKRKEFQHLRLMVFRSVGEPPMGWEYSPLTPSELTPPKEKLGSILVRKMSNPVSVPSLILFGTSITFRYYAVNATRGGGALPAGHNSVSNSLENDPRLSREPI